MAAAARGCRCYAECGRHGSRIMDKDVTLRILGLHMESGQEGTPVETVARAEYFRRGEAHYALYEEPQDGTKNRIKLKKGVLELIKQGAVEAHLVFEEGRHHETRYATPYGLLILGTDTKKLAVEETVNHIKVDVEYALFLEGQHQSDSRLTISIWQDESHAI